MKRRKIEHCSADDEADNASFASFDSEERGGAVEDAEDVGLDDDMSDVGNGVSDEDEDMQSNDSGDLGDGEDGLLPDPEKGRLPKSNHLPERAVRKRASNSGSMAGTFKSNTFKIQVDELLDQVRPRRGKREIAAEDALHKLKTTIEMIPSRESLPIAEAERQLLMSTKTVVPFPNPRPPKDAKYKAAYNKPSNINIIGSYSLKTSSRARGITEIDMMVSMPSSLFQEKDYLNYRYFHKRAYYIACVAAGVQKAHADEFRICFQNFHDNPLKTVLVVTPVEYVKEVYGFKNQRWQINIIPCISNDTLVPGKMLPEKNCVRASRNETSNGKSAEPEHGPTPFYNSSLRSDMLSTSYLKLLHSASKRCAAFQDACLLGSTWLRQRGFGSNIHSGGFGNFEFSVLMAVLLEQSQTAGRSILNENYSVYQLFKATLQQLSTRDFRKDPLVLGTHSFSSKALPERIPIAWDGERSHNLLFKMTPWGCDFLRCEAKTTLNTLGDSRSDGFEASFILRTDSPLYRYDHTMTIDSSLVRDNSAQDHVLPGEHHHLYGIFQRALGDRIRLLNIIPQWVESWDTACAVPGRTSKRALLVGFIVNPDTVHRTIDHGPSAESKDKATAFRSFWGDRAELRRFKDGSILESLAWSGTLNGHSVFEEIVHYVIQKHIGYAAEQNIRLIGDLFKRMLPQTAGLVAFHPLMEAYKQLESDFRGLDTLPLSLRQILPADAQLRFASETLPKNAQTQTPADVIVQFEGSSRWPDDLVAIQRTKIAFLLKIGEQLEDFSDRITARVGLENEQYDTLNQAFLDITYESAATFRMRIHHDREQTLLERKLQDKSTDARSREVAALGLAKYKRSYLKAPTFTQAIARLCSRYAAMSGTIRLAKKWFACHFLANQIEDEVVEMLVARTFVQPWPWQTPSSVQTGFLRTLFWISRWDWRAEPLIVDLSGSDELKAPEIQGIKTTFEAWRKLDPALNRVVLFCASNIDPDGATWTDGKPAKVVAGRMTSLARAACAEVEQKQFGLEPGSLFSSPLSDFDFVLHLSDSVVDKNSHHKRRKSSETTFKNLELALQDSVDNIRCHPLDDLVRELEALYGSAMLLFSGGHDRPAIAGLWNPQASAKAWKVNLAYSTIPARVGDENDVQAEMNKEAILSEMARLGSHLIESIEVHRR